VKKRVLEDVPQAFWPIPDRRSGPALPPEEPAQANTVQADADSEKSQDVEHCLALCGDLEKDGAGSHEESSTTDRQGSAPMGLGAIRVHP
jgi:hypothetical protein